MARHLTVDRSGRLVLPKSVRDDLHLGPGSRMRMEQRGNALVLTPEPEDVAVEKRDGLLVVTEDVTGPLPDHREIREARTRRHGRPNPR